MLQTKIKTSRILPSILSIALLAFIFLPKISKAVEYKLDSGNTIETWQINQDINEKRAEIQELERQISVYQKNITAKQRQVGNLASQISTLDDSIAKINLEIQSTALEMETLNLKIDNTELKIAAKEKEISDQKEILAGIIRSLHRQQQKNSILEILILNDNFSDFLSDINQLENMRDSLFDGVEQLDSVKLALTDSKTSIETEKTELNNLKSILDNKIANLDDQKSTKSSLIIATQGQESKYQELLRQAKEEQLQANSDIVYLEQIAREKVNRQLALDNIASDGLMWPVDSRRVTTYFHDPEYPYRYIFEHPAIDIGTPQGTPLRAAESGYVAKAKDGGATGYSYIMLIHADGLSTVYGHVNKINVTADQFVSKGDVIGYSGGMPGTHGAGQLTTGPHLHLEVRLNGVPVDPLNYLP